MDCEPQKNEFQSMEMLVAIALVAALTSALLLPGMWRNPENIDPLEATATGTGLTGIYYSGPDFTGTSSTRVDDQINFNWGQKSPAGLMPMNSSSVAWVGLIRSDHNETYVLHVEAHGGVRLFINARTLIDDWEAKGHNVHKGTIKLSPNELMNLTLNLQQQARTPSIRLYWSSPSTPRQLIPTSHLFPTIRDDVSIRQDARPVTQHQIENHD